MHVIHRVHLSFGYSIFTWTFGILHGHLQKMPFPFHQHQKPLHVYIMYYYTMLQGTNIHKGFSTKGKKYFLKSPPNSPNPQKTKTQVWVSWQLSCQTLKNSSICNYSALTSFPRAAVGSCPAHFQHTEVQFLRVVPSTDGAAALQGERINCPCVWVSINESPAFLGRTVLTQKFPEVGKAGAGNRGYEQGRARKKQTNKKTTTPAHGKWWFWNKIFFFLQNHNTVQ